ncbi:MAG: hypothetical protein AB7E48_10575 [Deferribacterales bacterium]
MKKIFPALLLAAAVAVSGCSMSRDFGNSFKKEYKKAVPEAKKDWKEAGEDAGKLPSKAKDGAVNMKDGTVDVYEGVTTDLKKIH